MEKWMVYYEILRLRLEGFKNSSIAKKLKISRNRVIEYREITPDEIQKFILSLQHRSKKLDPYENHILEWLKEHPDLSGAQVLDWLQEKLDVHSVSEVTVRNFVNGLRERHCIPKTNTERNYIVVPELRMGKQIKVDFGETRQRTT